VFKWETVQVGDYSGGRLFRWDTVQEGDCSGGMLFNWETVQVSWKQDSVVYNMPFIFRLFPTSYTKTQSLNFLLFRAG